MKNRSIIIAVCSAIVIALAGCANSASDSGMSDNAGTISSYDSAMVSGTSEPITDSSEPAVSTGSGSENSAPVTSGGSDKDGASTAADIGLDAAKAAALNHAGIAEADASFTEAKLDYDDGVAEYDIEFIANAKRYEYEIRASDGAVLEFSSEPIPDPTGLLSEARAKELALAHFSFSEEQVTFTKCKLDYDNGISEYEIAFTANGVEHEIELNAKTGEILKSEIDRD